MRPNDVRAAAALAVGEVEGAGPRLGGTRRLPLVVNLVLVSVIAADQLRLLLPSQPLFVTAAPLLLASLGAAAGLLKRAGKDLPRGVRFAGAAVIALCVFGSAVGLAKGLPVRQIAAGWLAYAGWLPGALLGVFAGSSEAGRRTLHHGSKYLLAFAIGFAVLQQFGVLTREVALEDYHEMRGVEDLGIVVRYTTGPFRTASVLAIFVASVSTIFISTRSVTPTHGRERALEAMVLAGALLASVLAARRSGLAMLLGALVPFVALNVRRVFVGAVAAIGAVVVVVVLFRVEINPDVSREIQGKIAHSTVAARVAQRLSNTFDVDASALSILSATGDGLGSHGQAVRAGGYRARADDELLLHRYPVLHFGWYKDLLSFGPFGLLLLISAFVSLARACWPGPLTLGPGRYSTVGYVSMSCFVYLLVATSWMHSLSGGVLFGLAAGVGALPARAGAGEHGGPI